jgi:hypothetical protein
MAYRQDVDSWLRQDSLFLVLSLILWWVAQHSASVFLELALLAVALAVLALDVWPIR